MGKKQIKLECDFIGLENNVRDVKNAKKKKKSCKSISVLIKNQWRS